MMAFKIYVFKNNVLKYCIQVGNILNAARANFYLSVLIRVGGVTQELKEHKAVQVQRGKR